MICHPRIAKYFVYLGRRTSSQKSARSIQGQATVLAEKLAQT
jgi:hypothetical protein